jgi:hypothetical protein
MTPKEHASQLLAEWIQCKYARPKSNAVDIQLDKDNCQVWAQHLTRQYHWGSDLEISEACYQFEPRLRELREKVIIEILKNGAV